MQGDNQFFVRAYTPRTLFVWAVLTLAHFTYPSSTPSVFSLSLLLSLSSLPLLSSSFLAFSLLSPLLQSDLFISSSVLETQTYRRAVLCIFSSPVESVGAPNTHRALHGREPAADHSTAGARFFLERKNLMLWGSFWLAVLANRRYREPLDGGDPREPDSARLRQISKNASSVSSSVKSGIDGSDCNP